MDSSEEKRRGPAVGRSRSRLSPARGCGAQCGVLASSFCAGDGEGGGPSTRATCSPGRAGQTALLARVLEAEGQRGSVTRSGAHSGPWPCIGLQDAESPPPCALPPVPSPCSLGGGGRGHR